MAPGDSRSLSRVHHELAIDPVKELPFGSTSYSSQRVQILTPVMFGECPSTVQALYKYRPVFTSSPLRTRHPTAFAFAFASHRIALRHIIMSTYTPNNTVGDPVETAAQELFGSNKGSTSVLRS
jgi:hypothetical protein